MLLIRKIKKVVVLVLCFLSLVATTQNVYGLSLGDEPTYGNLYQTLLFSESSEGGVKDKKISYEIISRYPGEADDGEYNYWRITTSEKVTEQGVSLATTFRVLDKYGWYQGVNNTTPSRWWVNIKSGASKTIAIGTSIFSSFVGFFGRVGELIIDVISYFSNAILPGALMNDLGGLATQTIDPSKKDNKSWVKEFVDAVIETVVGDVSSVLKIIWNIAFWIWAVSLAISVITLLTKGNLRNLLQPFRKFVIVSSTPILFLLIYPSFASTVKETISDVELKETTSEKEIADNYVIDTLKLAVATNFDMSVIYPNKSLVLSNSTSDLKDFKVSEKIVSKANERIKEKLGVLNDKIDDDSDELELMDLVTSSELADVSDYINYIEMGSVSGIRKNTSINANNILDGMSWGKEAEHTFDVPDYGDLQEVLGETFTFKGKPVFFDNIVSKADSKDAEATEIGYRNIDMTKGSVAYSKKNYKAYPIARGRAWTYLYGVKEESTWMSANLANYTADTMNKQTYDLTKKIGEGGSFEGASGTEAIENHQNNIADFDEKGYLETLDEGATAQEKATAKADAKAEAYGKESKYYQHANLYTLAMFNKYAGIDTPAISSGALSNQSTAMLLQSLLDKKKIHYKGYYVNFSDADKGKITVDNKVSFRRYVVPSNGVTDYMGKIVLLQSMKAGKGVLLVGVAIALVRISLGNLVRKQWTNFIRIFTKGSVASLLSYLITDIAINIVFKFTKITSVAGLSVMAQLLKNLPKWMLAVPETIGFLSVFVAMALVFPYMKINTRRVSPIEIGLLMVIGFSDYIERPLKRLERALIGSNNNNQEKPSFNLDNNLKNSRELEDIKTSEDAKNLTSKNPKNLISESPKNVASENPNQRLKRRMGNLAVKTLNSKPVKSLASKTVGGYALYKGINAYNKVKNRPSEKGKIRGEAKELIKYNYDKFTSSELGVRLGTKGEFAKLSHKEFDRRILKRGSSKINEFKDAKAMNNYRDNLISKKEYIKNVNETTRKKQIATQPNVNPIKRQKKEEKAKNDTFENE